MLKKYMKLFSLIIVFVIAFSNFALATSVSEDIAEDTPKSTELITGNENIITSENVENLLVEGGTQVSSWAVKIMGVVSDVSLPICALLCLWGAILYFILGIRNLYKKRQGMLLMWGSFTFLVIAKVAYFFIWFFVEVI